MSASENPGRRRPTRTRRPATARRTSPAFGTTWRRAHLTVEEREARGKQGRKDAPRASHGAWSPAADRPDPIALLEEQAGDAGAGARPDPVRTDARVAVLVLPRRGADHGGRPRPDPEIGGHRAAVRRCPPLELRPVRLRRAQAALRRQRLRRDAAGPVGVGRQAPGRELRRARTRSRVLGEGPAVGRARGRARLPGAHAPRRRDAHARLVVRPSRRSTGSWSASAPRPAAAGSARARPAPPKARSRRRARATASACSPSARPRWTASCGSSPTRR